MKIEKIAENIIRVTLHTVELKKWRVSGENLNSESPEVCLMFRDIIRRINQETGIDFSKCSLSVEVVIPDRDTVIMTMSGKTSGLNEARAKAVNCRYKIRSRSKNAVAMVYSFEDIEAVTAFAKNNLYYCLLFDGKNSLYKAGNGVKLVVNVPGTLREFLPAFNDKISEYADISCCPELCFYYIDEYEKPIIGKEALKTFYYKM